MKPGDDNKDNRWHLGHFKNFLMKQVKTLTVDQIQKLTDRSRQIIRNFKENPDIDTILKRKRQKKWQKENREKVRENSRRY